MMTRKAWRTKSKINNISPDVAKPGDRVSVDQLESPVPGFVGQLRGKPTFARYIYATIFVDTFSRFSYIHLQQTSNAEETLESKKHFEAYARSYGIIVKHYHADNGRFIENAWQSHTQLTGQTMSFAGVGAHHQNGIVEKRIRDLQDLARLSLIHAMTRWTSAITTHLWPYVLQKANSVINLSIKDDQSRTPMELFAGVEISPNLRNHHPFDCPVYVLERKMQGGFKAWSSRARMCIYLGNSDHYASNVGLVRSLTAGLVSPQFHLKFDDEYNSSSTIREHYSHFRVANKMWVHGQS
jgi:transposase InsO family protein